MIDAMTMAGPRPLTQQEIAKVQGLIRAEKVAEGHKTFDSWVKDKALNTNGDARISRQEIVSFATAKPDEGGLLPETFAEQDLNGDGELTRDEAGAANASKSKLSMLMDLADTAWNGIARSRALPTKAEVAARIAQVKGDPYSLLSRLNATDSNAADVNGDGYINKLELQLLVAMDQNRY